jgi:hypothetical protein
MKFLSSLVFFVALSQIVLGGSIEEGLRRLLNEAKAHPTKENVVSLADAIDGNYRYQSLLTPSALAATNGARDELCKIPGHARYIAEEIKREQEEVKDYGTNSGPRVTYDRQRAWRFETLRYLPSPEAILVLGEFLSDDLDTPQPLVSEGSDWGENARANSFFSSKTISEIGLRDPPASRDSFDIQPEKHLATTREWWDEVKAGKRAFSFKGQNVEYRFKPDGTWETLAIANPSDDGPGRPQAGPTRPPLRPATEKRESRESQVTIIPWLVAFAAVVFAAAAWWAMRNKTA